MARENRKKRERRILVTASLVALIIAAGGTFAWFSSKDEVTNKLTAEQDYNVVITENFKTPSSWTPGQEVEKEVSVLNVGNTDAFVRVNLTDAISVITKLDEATFAVADVAKYKEISADEALALQAGGINVVNAGTIETSTTEGTAFTPSDAGLYVFERNLGDRDDVQYREYAAYYYAAGKYYKATSLDVTTSSTTGEITNATAKVSLTTGTAVEGTPTFNYEHVSDGYIVATYAGANATDTADDIIINILIDKDADWTFNDVDNTFYYNKVLPMGKTTYSMDGNHYLITAVELDKSVTNEAYVSFEYSLTVNLDSVQAVEGEDVTVAVAEAWKTNVSGVSEDAGNVTWTFKQ